MKPFMKIFISVVLLIWIGALTMMSIVVVQRQIRFERLTQDHIELLYTELSETNIRLSIVEDYLDKVKKYFIEAENGIGLKLDEANGGCRGKEELR